MKRLLALKKWIQARSMVIGVILVLAHLTLVLGGALKQRLGGMENPVGKALRIYGSATGSDSSYAFFAPGVGSQLRATFILTDKDGNTRVATLPVASSHEAELRMNNVISMFYEEEMRPIVAASLAATLFGRNPDAVVCHVKVEIHAVPSMEEYRAGVRPSWAPYYEAHIVRNKDSVPSPLVPVLE